MVVRYSTIFDGNIIQYPKDYQHFAIISFALDLFEGLGLFGNFDIYFIHFSLVESDFLLHF